ncbi:MFS transporter [Candidatus Pantoea formicae]|uniref:MFS transporter n=1 Tax=Candidatus Pantoea formicae TaxID=2608355 RepID=UPI003EDA5304
MITDRRIALVCAICLGTFMASLDISIVNVALPTMLTSLNTDMPGIQWVVDAYALCLSALILSSGPLGDRFGRKRVWMAGIVLFTLGSLLCASASSLEMLLTGRVLQGVAGAAVIPGALSLLSHAFPDELQRVRVIGIWSTVSASSLVIGPILGGILVHNAGWQSIFLINLPVGVVTLLLGGWGIQESAHPDHASLDPLGQLFSVLWLGTLTYGLIAAGDLGWRDSGVQFSLFISLLFLALFIWAERRVTRPLLPLYLFKKSDFTVYNLSSAVMGFSSYSSVFFVSLFLQQAQGWSALQTGWRMAPEFIAMALVSTQFGRLSARFSVKTLIVVGYALIGAGLLLLGTLQSSSAYPFIALFLIILGTGTGLAMPATSALVMRTVVSERSGMASATMNAVRQTGMTMGIALLGTLMNMHAIEVLRVQLTAQHVSEADSLAHSAIMGHQSLAGIPAWVEQVQHAFASGFSLAMAGAGVASVAMAGGLILMHRAHRRVVIRSVASTGIKE